MVSAPLRKRLACLALATVVVASVCVSAQAQTAVRSAPIDRNGLIILLKSTLIALDQANKSGNYSVLRDLAAPGFAAANDPARLAEIFSNLRRDKVDLSGALVLEPQLTTMPEITQNGMLHFAGVFPSAPTQIHFELLFAPVDGQWRLFGISTNLGSATPVAPPAPAKPPAQPSPPAKGGDGIALRH